MQHAGGGVPISRNDYDTLSGTAEWICRGVRESCRHDQGKEKQRKPDKSHRDELRLRPFALKGNYAGNAGPVANSRTSKVSSRRESIGAEAALMDITAEIVPGIELRAAGRSLELARPRAAGVPDRFLSTA
jgi:hypothetical protein